MYILLLTNIVVSNSCNRYYNFIHFSRLKWLNECVNLIYYKSTWVKEY